MDFQALLVKAGAVEPRSKRGKWRCWLCGKVRLSVNLDRQLFHCFTSGCACSGNMTTLANQLGYKMNSPEWVKKASEGARRHQAEERAEALRRKVHQSVGERFRATMRMFDKVRAAILESGGQSDLLENCFNLYADLLGLSGELLLLEILPSLQLCEFIGGPEPTRQKMVMEAISRDGVWVDGRFHALPPVVFAHSTADVLGVVIPDEQWRLQQ